MSNKVAYLVANFGGPRSLSEIEEFLTALLTDRDVIRTKLPGFLQTMLFRRIARKRSKKIIHDYQMIGGKSPIFQDTEDVAGAVGKLLEEEILTFHRYLPATHSAFINKMEALSQEKIVVFPMFPQFSYATTGSIARWFYEHLSSKTTSKLRWVKSYPAHQEFVSCHQEAIRAFLRQNDLNSENTVLLFSAHGLPRQFICAGDIYQSECEASFHSVMSGLPGYKGLLTYQSKFGKGEWLRPYTDEACKEVHSWHEGKQNIVFVPITFTSDHIETLYEVEHLYLPVIREQGLVAHRCPALGLQDGWIETIAKIMQAEDLFDNDKLIRREQQKSCLCCS